MRNRWQCIFILSFLVWPVEIQSKDYILTIGGGYEPSGNQASLEANVLFFQQVIRERHPSSAEHQIFFADGFDTAEDLQILMPKTKAESSALELLNSVFDLGRDRIAYRDHQVPNIRGALNPSAIRKGFEEIAERLVYGDRLIIYVTAHGSSAKGSDPYNTSITCWNKRALSMKSFSEWLDQVPSSVPVIMIMAQCYCGGFANTMFADGDPQNGFARGLRVGFFAQRHDLPAAGCRPDIENDEEYSSYFWGAFIGRSRTGKPVGDVDCDGDGRVSFAEAHTHAVVASQTIDIPLRTSDTFLRHYSRIGGYDDLEESSDEESSNTTPINQGLYYLTGTVEEIIALGTPDQRRMVIGLAQQLDIPVQSEVSEVFVLSESQREVFRQSRRSPGRRGRFSRRRELRTAIIEKWPELAATDDWPKLDLLKAGKSDDFLDQVRQLPSFEPFQQSQADRLRITETSTQAELKNVQFRRLIYSLETIIYAQNLPHVAKPDEIEKYRAMLAIEGTSLER